MALLGINAGIYFSTDVDATPPSLSSMEEMTNAREVATNMTAGEADVTTRANDGWRAVVATLREATANWTMVWLPGDDGFEAVKDAYLASAEVHLCILDQKKTVSGAQGLKGNFTITEFTRDEQLEEAITVSVTAKLSRFDEWAEVP